MFRSLTPSLIGCLLANLPLPLAAENPPTVHILHYLVGAGRPTGARIFHHSPRGHLHGARIDLVVTGQRLVSFAPELCEITKATNRDGSLNFLKKDSGVKNHRWDPGKIHEKQTHAIIGLEFFGDLMGKMDGAILEGKIIVRTQDEKYADNATVRLVPGGKPAAVGTFSVKTGNFVAMQAEAGGFKSPHDSDEWFGLAFIGNQDLFLGATAKANGRNLRPEHPRTRIVIGNKTRIYNIKDPGKEMIDIKLKFLKQLKVIEIPFKLVVGGKK